MQIRAKSLDLGFRKKNYFHFRRGARIFIIFFTYFWNALNLVASFKADWSKRWRFHKQLAITERKPPGGGGSLVVCNNARPSLDKREKLLHERMHVTGT